MYVAMAKVAAERSSCQRAKVGAVITDIHMSNVLAIGYNGPPRRLPNECPGDANTPGHCGCIHAEVNALLKAPFNDTEDQLLFVTKSPCVSCARLILNSRVYAVFYAEPYRDDDGVKLLVEHGIGCEIIV